MCLTEEGVPEEEEKEEEAGGCLLKTRISFLSMTMCAGVPDNCCHSLAFAGASLRSIYRCFSRRQQKVSCRSARSIVFFCAFVLSGELLRPPFSLNSIAFV